MQFRPEDAWRCSIFYFHNAFKCGNRFTCHFPLKLRQALLAGKQFLHGAFLDLALFGKKLLQGFDEGIRVAQCLGDGFLFGERGREGAVS